MRFLDKSREFIRNTIIFRQFNSSKCFHMKKISLKTISSPKNLPAVRRILVPSFVSKDQDSHFKRKKQVPTEKASCILKAKILSRDLPIRGIISGDLLCAGSQLKLWKQRFCWQNSNLITKGAQREPPLVTYWLHLNKANSSQLTERCATEPVPIESLRYHHSLSIVLLLF